MTRPPFAAVRATATPQFSEREYRAQRIADDISLEALRLIESAFLGQCTRREAAHELLRVAAFATHPGLADRKTIISRACRLAWDEAEKHFSTAAVILEAHIWHLLAEWPSDIDIVEQALELAEELSVHWRLVLPLLRRIEYEHRLVRDGLARARNHA